MYSENYVNVLLGVRLGVYFDICNSVQRLRITVQLWLHYSVGTGCGDTTASNHCLDYVVAVDHYLFAVPVIKFITP